MAAHGIVNFWTPGYSYPTEPQALGTEVEIYVGYGNDGDAVGNFKIRYSSPQGISGETRGMGLNPNEASGEEFFFTMPNEAVNLKVELIRIT